jgi:putative transposase
LFNFIDDFNREALDIEKDLSLPSQRVIRSLDQIICWRGKPNVIRSLSRNNRGPEYIGKIFKQWAREADVVLHYSQPGNPQ